MKNLIIIILGLHSDFLWYVMPHEAIKSTTTTSTTTTLKSATTDNDARLDVKWNGLWESRFNRTFFDVTIFNPLSKSFPESSSDVPCIY